LRRPAKEIAVRPLLTEIRRTPLSWLLIFVPMVPAVERVAPDRHTLLFVLSVLAIVPLAALLSHATESVAARTGDAAGGLLNAMLGNLTELVIALAALRAGEYMLVKATVAGAIVTNTLFMLGASFLIGGLAHHLQRFNPVNTRVQAGLLFLAILALLVPSTMARVDIGADAGFIHELSVGLAVLLITAYGLGLVFSLSTHRELFARAEHAEEEDAPPWPLGLALATLAGVTDGLRDLRDDAARDAAPGGVMDERDWSLSGESRSREVTMTGRTAVMVVTLALALAAWPCGAQEKTVVAPGAQVEKLAGDFTFTEGPTCDADGNLYFTDQPNNRILKWSVEGKLSTALQPAGRANGMYFAPSGELIACADEKTALWSIARDGTVSVILSEHGGKALNGPNDVWVRPDGALYFTDPFYKRPWWTYDAMPQDGQHVYFLSADRRRLVRVTDDLTQPNGIIGTPDGKTLYVSDIRARKTYRYDVAPDGALSNKTLVVEQGSDGMTLDSEGNLYLTGDGVMVIDRTGQLIERIRVPDERWTANVSFCGKDGQTLFMTATTGLYAVRTRVKGANRAK
jgi:gluconolactonase